jgi:hypothetical protein
MGNLFLFLRKGKDKPAGEGQIKLLGGMFKIVGSGALIRAPIPTIRSHVEEYIAVAPFSHGSELVQGVFYV